LIIFGTVVLAAATGCFSMNIWKDVKKVHGRKQVPTTEDEEEGL